MANQATKRKPRPKLYEQFMLACYRSVLSLGLPMTWKPDMAAMYYQGTATFEQRMQAWRNR